MKNNPKGEQVQIEIIQAAPQAADTEKQQTNVRADVAIEEKEKE